MDIMSDFLMKPKIDYAFKEIMMDEKARIGFLSAVLNLNPADIRKTELLNTSLRKLHEDEKQGIVDVRIPCFSSSCMGRPRPVLSGKDVYRPDQARTGLHGI